MRENFVVSGSLRCLWWGDEDVVDNRPQVWRTDRHVELSVVNFTNIL